MTHKVIMGETLSKIAKAHNITVAQLLDANPRFRADPDLVRAGDVLNIPEGESALVTETPPVEPQTQPQPQPAAGTMLGTLSEQFETSGRGPGTVSGGQGDPGGPSYGSYQMTSMPNGGTVKRFVLRSEFPFRNKFINLTPGSSQFTQVWREIAASHPDEFQRSQHEFIKQTHFDPLVEKILEEDRLNVLTRSHTLQDVIWSTAVQHGPGSNIPHLALSTLTVGSENADFDRSFIRAIYKERGRKKASGGLVHFPRASPAVQKGVAKRFETELKLALEMLAKETSV
jgi:hypothetical protein